MKIDLVGLTYMGQAMKYLGLCRHARSQWALGPSICGERAGMERKPGLVLEVSRSARENNRNLAVLNPETESGNSSSQVQVQNEENLQHHC